MIKCTKAEVRRLKTALHWKKVPPAQRERIQIGAMARKRDDAARDCARHGCIVEHGEPRAHGL